MGKWKLIKPEKAKSFELYDLSTDISESKNVAADNPEIVKKLKKLLNDHIEEMFENKRPRGKISKIY